MPPAFHTPNSATRNCGQLGSSSATRSPLRTPMATSAAPKASLSASSRAVRHRGALEEQRRLLAVLRRERPQVVEQGLVRIRPERGLHVGVVVRQPGLHGGHSRSGRSGRSGGSGGDTVGRRSMARRRHCIASRIAWLSHITRSVAWQRADGSRFIEIRRLVPHISSALSGYGLSVAGTPRSVFSRGQYVERISEASVAQDRLHFLHTAEASLAELGILPARRAETRLRLESRRSDEWKSR